MITSRRNQKHQFKRKAQIKAKRENIMMNPLEKVMMKQEQMRRGFMKGNTEKNTIVIPKIAMKEEIIVIAIVNLIVKKIHTEEVIVMIPEMRVYIVMKNREKKERSIERIVEAAANLKKNLWSEYKGWELVKVN
jgi:hypothetical protein